MQLDHPDRQLRELLPEQFCNKSLLATPSAVDDFVRRAAAKRVYVDDLA